jgi:predicted TIM-barrel fold metal-dependent hydrolase
MDRNGVDRAVLVCAQIDHNPGNNDYVAECVGEHPDRLVQFADVDCCWSETYHAQGAAARLADAARRYRLKGFTHYLKDDYDWFESEEGLAFFETAAELRLIASLALGPGWQPALRALARRFPSVPFLCHHMAGAKAAESARPQLDEILRSADAPNVYVKLSGFHYASHVSWEYPYSDTHWIVRKLYEHYGPERLCWGSDYPVVRFSMTYQHALEAFRTHCSFIPEPDRQRIFGPNLQRLLEQAGS